jgi:hypothetical protein
VIDPSATQLAISVIPPAPQIALAIQRQRMGAADGHGLIVMARQGKEIVHLGLGNAHAQLSPRVEAARPEPAIGPQDQHEVTGLRQPCHIAHQTQRNLAQRRDLQRRHRGQQRSWGRGPDTRRGVARHIGTLRAAQGRDRAQERGRGRGSLPGMPKRPGIQPGHGRMTRTTGIVDLGRRADSRLSRHWRHQAMTQGVAQGQGPQRRRHGQTTVNPIGQHPLCSACQDRHCCSLPE